MPLTDDDLDRLGDKLKLSVHEAMDAHMEKVHIPVWHRLEKIERHQWYERGVIGAVLVGLGWLEAHK